MHSSAKASLTIYNYWKNTMSVMSSNAQFTLPDPTRRNRFVVSHRVGGVNGA